MTKKPPNRPKKLDDAALWQRVAANIEPLPRRHKNLRHEGQPAPSQTPPARPKGGQRISGPGVVGSVAPPGQRRRLPELDHRTSPGVDKSTAAKLKKGRRVIEARLDLHGMTQRQAHAALDSFMENCSLAGRRCVLVITGKGTRPDGSPGVLRQAVPRWLNLAPNRPRILAFSYATAKDGGEGAIYVLLKRKR